MGPCRCEYVLLLRLYGSLDILLEFLDMGQQHATYRLRYGLLQSRKRAVVSGNELGLR